MNQIKINSDELFKCLADESRRRIISGLQKEPMYVELISERTGLSASTVSFHLKKLEAAGLISSQKEQYYTVYTLNSDALSAPISLYLEQDESARAEAERREEEYRKKVLRAFMPDGRVTALPVQRKKRNIVFAEILKAFEPGREYAEKEVNLIISDYYDDFCFVRRGFVEEGWMSRDHGVYVRPAED